MEGRVAALVPLKQKKYLWFDEGKKRKLTIKKVVETLRDFPKQDFRLLGIMGGPGQALFVRAVRLGISVSRIPRFKLQQSTGIVPKADAGDVAKAIIKAWQQNPGSFYALEQYDEAAALLRQLTRVRLGVQDFRKRAQLQFYSALRELRLILPTEAEPVLDIIEEAAKDDLLKNPKTAASIEKALHGLSQALLEKDRKRVLAVTEYFANPGFILGAKTDEQKLERQIFPLLQCFPVWQYLHPEAESVLPEVKGFGPSLAGSLLSEISRIERYPSPEALRAYARFHVNRDNKFPQRKAGEVANWNDYLDRAVWLWSTDQMPRYHHVWSDLLYTFEKTRELKAHSEVKPREVRDKQGRTRMVYDYTLKHLDSRAKRRVGSRFLEYLWDIWTAVAKGIDPEEWYPKSCWPGYFERVRQEITEGNMLAYLEEEISKRRRVEPEEEKEEEEVI